MTRKNYETFAKMLAGELASAMFSKAPGANVRVLAVANIIRMTADIFAKDNEKFDRERFYAACGMASE